MVTAYPMWPLGKRFWQVYQLYHQAFPPAECLPFLPLWVNSWRKGVSFEALARQGRFIGLTYMLADEAHVFLLFLAISETEQGKGYGSQVLENLEVEADDRTLLVAIEPLDAKAPNAQQRQKRLAFYQRYGYQLVPYTYHENGETYQLLATRPDLDVSRVNTFLSKVFWPGVSAYVQKTV